MNSKTEPKKKLSIAELKNVAIIAQATSGKSIKEIAEEHGRNRKWLSLQLNHPKNQAIFSEIYQATIDEAIARLPALVAKAFDVMEKELQVSYSSDRRVTAAKAILGIAGKHWQPQPCICNCRDEKVIQACEADQTPTQ